MGCWVLVGGACVSVGSGDCEGSGSSVGSGVSVGPAVSVGSGAADEPDGSGGASDSVGAGADLVGLGRLAVTDRVGETSGRSSPSSAHPRGARR